jgi:hypothetical protein
MRGARARVVLLRSRFAKIPIEPCKFGIASDVSRPKNHDAGECVSVLGIACMNHPNG